MRTAESRIAARRGQPTGDVAISPWLEALVEQYRAAPAAGPRRGSAVAVVVAAVAAGAAGSPTLLRFYAEGYPSEPEQRQALETCGRADPTFVRFLASQRAACYARFPHLVAPAAFEATRPARAGWTENR